MKRPVFWMVLAAAIVTACALPHGGVIFTGDNAQMIVYVEVSDATNGLPISGAAVRYWYTGAQSSAAGQLTKADGTTAFWVPTTTRDSHMWVEAEGYTPADQYVRASPGMIVRFVLKNPSPPTVVAKTRDEVKSVQTNFLNLRDNRGKVQFSPFIGGHTEARQVEWMENEIRAGSTHFVVAVNVNGYRDLDDPDLKLVHFYEQDKWQDFDALLGRLMARRLTPIIFLHDGGPYPGDAYFTGLCRWWLAHWPTLTTQVVMVPAWEPVRFGDWSAAQFDAAVRIMRAELGQDAILGFHGSPGTHTFGDGHNANPADPWNGLGEPDEWMVHAGAEIDVFLFQTLYVGFPTSDRWGQPEWWDRALDVAERFLPQGTPMPGAVGVRMMDRTGAETTRDGYAGGPKSADWFGGSRRARGRPTLVAFEYVAYGYVRGQTTDAQVTATADKLWDMGYRYFGNGLASALKR